MRRCFINKHENLMFFLKISGTITLLQWSVAEQSEKVTGTSWNLSSSSSCSFMVYLFFFLVLLFFSIFFISIVHFNLRFGSDYFYHLKFEFFFFFWFPFLFASYCLDPMNFVFQLAWSFRLHRTVFISSSHFLPWFTFDSS